MVSAIAESQKSAGTDFFERNDFIMIFYDDSKSEKKNGRTEMWFSSRFPFFRCFQRISFDFPGNRAPTRSGVAAKSKGNPLKTLQKSESTRKTHFRPTIFFLRVTIIIKYHNKVISLKIIGSSAFLRFRILPPLAPALAETTYPGGG